MKVSPNRENAFLVVCVSRLVMYGMRVCMRLKPRRTYDLKLDFYFLSFITPSLPGPAAPVPSQSIDWCMAVEGIVFFVGNSRNAYDDVYC